MKNVKYIFVLLLIVNCTADLPEVEETLDGAINAPEQQTCIDDLPKVRLTNNGTRSFDFIVYAQDYTQLHTQNVSSATDSGWIELSDNDVIVVVTNNVDYGQKIPLSLVVCDNKELSIDGNNILLAN
jgi:hypothetical protein